MQSRHEEIVAELNAFRPPNDDWDQLDAILQKLWKDGSPELAIPELLAVFSRYPENEDGCGVFWSILHGMEDIHGYERQLVNVVVQSPSEFGVMMIGRLVNGGVDYVGDTDLRALLRGLAKSDNASKRIRQLSERFANK